MKHVNYPMLCCLMFATTLNSLTISSVFADEIGIYVYPVPWRPHGPNSGDGARQTGTESGGMTFANLPDSCDIRIYSLSGELVRELRHSGGESKEKWDGRTMGGELVASGAYLWRIEGSSSAVNGKLMIIR